MNLFLTRKYTYTTDQSLHKIHDELYKRIRSPKRLFHFEFFGALNQDSEFVMTEKLAFGNISSIHFADTCTKGKVNTVNGRTTIYMNPRPNVFLLIFFYYTIILFFIELFDNSLKLAGTRNQMLITLFALAVFFALLILYFTNRLRNRIVTILDLVAA